MIFQRSISSSFFIFKLSYKELYMNKLLSGLCILSCISLSVFANDQTESTDKKVWISIGSDAAKLIEQQYSGFINLQSAYNQSGC